MKSNKALKYLEANGVYVTRDVLLKYARRGLGTRTKGNMYEYTMEALDGFIRSRKVLLSQGMLAYRLGCSRTSVERWMELGMPTVKYLGATYYDEDAIRQWCKDNKKNQEKYKCNKHGHKTAEKTAR